MDYFILKCLLQNCAHDCRMLRFKTQKMGPSEKFEMNNYPITNTASKSIDDKYILNGVQLSKTLTLSDNYQTQTEQNNDNNDMIEHSKDLSKKEKLTNISTEKKGSTNAKKIGYDLWYGQSPLHHLIC